MHQFSDSDSDSDRGIRYKTDSTRNKVDKKSSSDRYNDSRCERKHRSSRQDRHKRDRSRSYDRHKRHRSASRDRSSRHYKHKRKKRRSRSRDRSVESKEEKLSYRRDNSYVRNKDRSQPDNSKRSPVSGRSRTPTESKNRKSSLSPSPERDRNEGNCLHKEQDKVDSNIKKASGNNITFGPTLPPHLQKGKVNDHPQDTAILEKISSQKLTNDSNTFDLNSSSMEDEDASKEQTESKVVSNVITPALPPCLSEKDIPKKEGGAASPLHNNHNSSPNKKELDDEHSETNNILQNNETDKTIDVNVFGPTPPPHIQSKEPDNQPDTNTNEKVIIGPALPPHLQKVYEAKEDNQEQQEQVKVIGPTLPSDLKEKLMMAESNLEIGVNNQDSEDEDVYGPVLPGMAAKKAHIALEERAIQIKIDQLGPKEVEEAKREEWMLELPEAKAASFGLGPRQFRSKPAPDMSDRSSWTSTPQDAQKPAEKKIDLKEEAKIRQMQEKDREQEKIAKSAKRSKESLLDTHQKKMLKKKLEEPTERRPFSREIDLQVNRLDEAQKRAVMKGAKLLDDKFSSGQAKYL